MPGYIIEKTGPVMDIESIHEKETFETLTTKKEYKSIFDYFDDGWEIEECSHPSPSETIQSRSLIESNLKKENYNCGVNSTFKGLDYNSQLRSQNWIMGLDQKSHWIQSLKFTM